MPGTIRRRRRSQRPEGAFPDQSKHIRVNIKCDRAGCGKIFHRRDNLVRHLATHDRRGQRESVGTSPKSHQRSQGESEEREIAAEQLTQLQQEVNHDAPNLTNGNGLAGSQYAWLLEAEAGPSNPTLGREYSPASYQEPALGNTLGDGVNPFAVPNWDTAPTADQGDLMPVKEWDEFLLSLGVDMNATFPWSQDSLPPGATSCSPLATSTIYQVPSSALRQSPDFAQIDEGKRQAICTAFPELDLLSDPSFSRTAIEEALRCFWEYFAPQFPFVHQGTFHPNAAPITLLVMVILIGQYHMTPAVISATRISPMVRSKLFLDTNEDISLSLYQTLLLCHLYDEYMSTSSAQYNAQCFSSILVTLSRRRALCVHTGNDFEHPKWGNRGGEERSSRWEQWAEEETMVRCAYMQVLIDAQLQAVWGQAVARRHSAFLMKLRMPCPNHQWEATSEQDWQDRQSEPASQLTSSRDDTFLPGLNLQPYDLHHPLMGFSLNVRGAMAADEPVTGLDNPFSRLMILTGLDTVVCDAKMYGSIALADQTSTSWKNSLHYAMLKLRDPKYAPGSHPLAISLFRDFFTISVLSMFTDIVMLQVNAGSAVICGVAAGLSQRHAARQSLKQWANTVEARSAVTTAAVALQEIYHSDFTSRPSLLTSWAVYLATLVCWTFISIRKTPKALPFAPPAQLHIPGALSSLNELYTQLSQNIEPKDLDDRAYHILATAEFFMTEKSPKWGPGMQAVEVLRGLMKSVVKCGD